MKKILIIALAALCCLGCKKEDTPVTYSVNNRMDWKSQLPSVTGNVDVSLTLHFYEYNDSKIKIGTKEWKNPAVNSTKSFTAQGGATRVVTYYEIIAKSTDPQTPGKIILSQGKYFKEVTNIDSGAESRITLLPTSKVSATNPIDAL